MVCVTIPATNKAMGMKLEIPWDPRRPELGLHEVCNRLTMTVMGESLDLASRQRDLHRDRHLSAVTHGSATLPARVLRSAVRARPAREGVVCCLQAEWCLQPPAHETQLGQACALERVCPSAPSSVEPECDLQDNKGSQGTFRPAS